LRSGRDVHRNHPKKGREILMCHITVSMYTCMDHCATVKALIGHAFSKCCFFEKNLRLKKDASKKGLYILQP
jgi:hypothetical protein